MTSLVDLSGKLNFQEKAAPLEKQILATLLEMPSLLGGVAEVIEAEDFVSEAARQVYAWVRTQAKSHYEVSAALAQSRFAGVTSVEPYLLDLLCEMPSANALIGHAEQLRDIAARRDMFDSIQKNIPQLMQQGIPLETSLSKLAESVSRTTNRISSSKDTLRTYADVGNAWEEKFKVMVETGGGTGMPTGYDDLDDLLSGLQPADLVVIGGRPSMGKTTFAMNIIEHTSVVRNDPTMVFSLEMPSESIYQRSIASVGGIDFSDLRKGRLKVGDLEKLSLASEKLGGAPIYIDDSAGLSLNQLCARAIRAHKKYGIKLIMIDYLQLMQVAEYHRTNRNEGIGEISRGLKQLGKLLGIPIIVLSQLSRDLERRPNKRPIPADLRDSGAIEQDADVIIFVYRDEVYNPETEHKGIAEIIIGKQRNGALGTVFLAFGGAQSSFRNLKGGVPTLSSLKSNSDYKGGKQSGTKKMSGNIQQLVDSAVSFSSYPVQPDLSSLGKGDNIPF